MFKCVVCGNNADVMFNNNSLCTKHYEKWRLFNSNSSFRLFDKISLMRRIENDS